MAKHFDMLESLGQICGKTVKVGKKAAIDSVHLADVAALAQTTKITEVLGAIIELPSVPYDEEYRFRKRSADLLQKWNGLISLHGKKPGAYLVCPTIKKEAGNQNEPISTQTPSASPTVGKDQKGFIRAHEREGCRGTCGDVCHTSKAS